MDLNTWLSLKGNNKYSLAKRAGLSWVTVHRLARGRTRNLRTATAKAIEAATGGQITAAELLGLSEHEAA